MNDFSKHLRVILKKMCKSVNADFDAIDFKKEGWFLQHEWTQKQEDAFKKWMLEYLKKNRDARRELGIIFNNKIMMERGVNMFVMNYGWKTKS